MAPESVQVTDSESPVTVTVSEPKQPKQTHQTTPKQTSTSTPTPTQTQTQNSPQKAIPEPVVETIVPESVQVTESEQTVAITVSEPIQTTTQPSSTTITNDQPSSSSNLFDLRKDFNSCKSKSQLMLTILNVDHSKRQLIMTFEGSHFRFFSSHKFEILSATTPAVVQLMETPFSPICHVPLDVFFIFMFACFTLSSL